MPHPFRQIFQENMAETSKKIWLESITLRYHERTFVNNTYTTVIIFFLMILQVESFQLVVFTSLAQKNTNKDKTMSKSVLHAQHDPACFFIKQSCYWHLWRSHSSCRFLNPRGADIGTLTDDWSSSSSRNSKKNIVHGERCRSPFGIDTT